MILEKRLESKNSHILFAKQLSVLFAVIFIIAIAGFYNTYFRHLPFFDGGISISVHLHAFFMMAWLLMLIVQPLLVFSGRRSLHKAIGKYSWVLVILIVLSTGLLVIERFNVDNAKGVPIETNLAIRIVTIITMASFVTFYLFALKYKAKIAVHTRYMVGTGLTVIPASVTRLFYFLNVNSILSEFTGLLIINILVIGFIIRDKRKGINTIEKPYHVILGFQLFLTFYYCFLVGLSWY